MALKATLSKHSREELARHLSDPWMLELLETLRNIAASGEQSYTADRTISELEHQALNGSFRRGMTCLVESIPLLAGDPPVPPKDPLKSWGELQPLTPNPKALPTELQQTILRK